jgi:hypothetical protein
MESQKAGAKAPAFSLPAIRPRRLVAFPPQGRACLLGIMEVRRAPDQTI